MAPEIEFRKEYSAWTNIRMVPAQRFKCGRGVAQRGRSQIPSQCTQEGQKRDLRSTPYASTRKMNDYF